MVRKRSRDPSKEHRSGQKITTLHDPYLFCVLLSSLHHSSLPRNKIERTGETYERFVDNRSETNGEIDRLCWLRFQGGNQSAGSPLERGQVGDCTEINTRAYVRKFWRHWYNPGLRNTYPTISSLNRNNRIRY